MLGAPANCGTSPAGYEIHTVPHPSDTPWRAGGAFWALPATRPSRTAAVMATLSWSGWKVTSESGLMPYALNVARRSESTKLPAAGAASERPLRAANRSLMGDDGVVPDLLRIS